MGKVKAVEHLTYEAAHDAESGKDIVQANFSQMQKIKHPGEKSNRAISMLVERVESIDQVLRSSKI